MTSINAKICMLSDSHGLYDDRIYWKEAMSLQNHGYEVYCIFAGSKNDKGVTDEGINYIEIESPVYSSTRYLNFLLKRLIPGGLYAIMLNKATALKADIYHIHDLKVNKIGRKLKSLSHHPKVIYDVHEPSYENILDYNKTKGIHTVIKWLYARHIRKWEQKCAIRYDFVITTEENVRDRFRKILPSEKVDIVYNYTDLDKTRKEVANQDRIYDAIYSGGITRLRGAFKILEAVKIITKQMSDFKMLFLGSYYPEDLKSEMLEFVQENDLQKNVVLHDSVPYTEVPGFYNKSKVGLGIFLPIRTHRIILQIKIFEYMSFGLPIIGSSFGHINDYIEKDNIGIVVNPEDPEEIANALIKILSDPKLYDMYSKNGLEASEKKYRWEFMEKKLIRIYSDLLN